MAALLVFHFVALPPFFIYAINISIYSLINDVGPKIEVDDVGFYAGPNCCFCRVIVILCHDITIFAFFRRLCRGIFRNIRWHNLESLLRQGL